MVADFRQIVTRRLVVLPVIRHRREAFVGGNRGRSRDGRHFAELLAVEMHVGNQHGALPDALFDRRRFLDALLTVGFVSTAAAIAYPVSQFLVPPATGEPATASVVAAKAAALRPNAGLIFKFGDKPGIVIRTPDGEVRAFSAVCTHLDCTVQYKADTSQLWCACHNGTYDLAGNVVSGPPPRGLQQFVVHVRGEPGEEEIVISRG